MSLPVGKVVAGAAAFSTAVYGGFTWAKTQKQLKEVAGSTTHQACQDGGCAFDRLAGVYDDIVGWEETSMWYGVLRWWLVRKAEGNVLELSAGTGRNLSHFRYSKITSLTLTDVSTSMLQQAQCKYFDQMKLQYAHPDLTCKFFLADAQYMVAGPGQQPHAVLLPQPPPSRTSNSGSSRASSSAGSSQAAASSGSMWRLKQPGTSSSSDSGSSGSSDAGSSGSSSSLPAPNTTADSLPAAGSTTSSGSSMGWRWSKQPQAHPTHKQPSSQATTTSSSSSTSNTAGQTAGSTFAPQSFDTIVDTFGLCSCDDPVAVLRQAAQLLKPRGKLLLLEHGRGTWDTVNSMIDERAERHHRTYGCWYNRDILGIVQDAGLQVDSLSRWHFGTSYVIVASPAASPQQLSAQPPPEAQQAAQAA